MEASTISSRRLLALSAGYLLLSVTIFSARAFSAQQSIDVTFECYTDEYGYDDTRISAETMAAIMKFHPFRLYPYMSKVPFLEECVEIDAKYKPCGDRTPASPHFLENAEVNVRESEKELTELESNAKLVPQMLSPLVEFQRDHLTFRIKFAKGVIQTLRNGDSQILAAVVNDYGFSKECGLLITPETLPKDKKALGDRLLRELYICTASYEPKSAKSDEEKRKLWQQFLSHYGVTTKTKNDYCDSI